MSEVVSHPHGMTAEERIERLEKQVDALMTAFQLSLVAAQPASEWLDAKLATIESEK